MTAPGAPDLIELPPMPEGFGEPQGAEAAARALQENEQRDDDENDDDTNTAESEPSIRKDEEAAPAASGPAPHPEKSPRARKAQSPGGSDGGQKSEAPGAAKPDKPEKVTAKLLKRIKHAVLVDRHLQLHARAAGLEAENAELQRRAAVANVLGTEAVDQGVRDLTSEVVDLLDNGAQAVAFATADKQVAEVIALDVDERTKLVRLGSPVIKKYLAEKAQLSPEIALLLGIGGIVLGKLVAVKLATSDRSRTSVVRSPDDVAPVVEDAS